MAKFADAFPIAAMVSTLSRHLRWNHVVNLQQMHKDGFTAAEYLTGLTCEAVLCADTKIRDLCVRSLAQGKFPVENRLGFGDFKPTINKIKAMATKVNKGLEFPAVALPGVRHMPAASGDEKEAARVFYVAATRATQKLMIAASGDGKFAELVFHRREAPTRYRHDGKTEITFEGRSSR
jgi:hypothetical protein